MHAMSLGSGLAISRLLSRPELTSEAACFVELARRKLVVSGTTLVLAILFAQPLILAWRNSWRLAYLIGLSLAMKFTTDGFFLMDVFTHVTNEFSFAILERAERKAVSVATLSKVEERYPLFRNALMSAAFDYLSSNLEDHTQMAEYESIVIGDEEEPVVNILIVHDAAEAAVLTELLADIESTEVVAAVTSNEEAISYFQKRRDTVAPLDLVIVASHLLSREQSTSLRGSELFEHSTGLCTEAVKSSIGKCHATHIPLIAVVGKEDTQRTIRLHACGTLPQCDTVLPSHVSRSALHVLVDACRL